MGKPIEQLSFWQARIKDALEKKAIHLSVFYTENFDSIDPVHKAIIKHKNISGKILDFGCGYGRISDWFTDYMGLDFVPDLIELAKQMFPDKQFLVGNIQKLPFNDGGFDWGIGVSMKRMIEDNLGQDYWKKCEGELLRVCKKLLILEYGEPHKYEIITKHSRDNHDFQMQGL